MTERLFLDIETDEAHDRLLLVGWAFDNEPVQVELGENVTLGHQVITALADPGIIGISHTLYDARWFTRHGYDVDGPWHDTRAMAWCINENTPLDLEWLTKSYCGYDPDKRLEPHAGRVYFRSKNGQLYPLDDTESWGPFVWAEFESYTKRDVVALRHLYVMLHRGLVETETLEYWEREEVPFTSVVIDMERNGLPVDLEATERLAGELEVLRDVAEAKLRRMAKLPASFNLNSPDQLALLLFSKWYQLPDKLPMDMDPLPPRADFEITSIGRLYIHGHWILPGLHLAPTPTTKKEKGQERELKHPSTESKELLYRHPADPWVREYCLVYKRLDKLLGTYLHKFPKIAVETGADHRPHEAGLNGGSSWSEPVSASVVGDADSPGRVAPVGLARAPTTRIFGRFNQGGTVTGRLSSSDPNMQNIPTRHEWGTRVRELFVGRFVIGDYDALEMRLMAHFSADPKLLRIFREGQDPHAITAHALFGGEYGHDDEERNIGKTCNYATGYGAGYRKLAQALSLEGFPTDAATAKEYLKLLRSFYPRYYRWVERIIAMAKESGGINTIAGRRRHLRGALDMVSGFKQAQYGERQAVNSGIQGSAADIIRVGMVRVRLEVPELRALAQIHDEAIWEYDTVPTPETLDLVRNIMENPYELRVPLVFEPLVCDNWSQKGEGSAIDILEEEARKT